MNREKVTIKRIGPTSALKVGASVGLVSGLIYAVFALLFLPVFYVGARDGLIAFIGVLLGGTGGGAIGALVTAWVYNIFLGIAGGLQLEIEFEVEEG